MKNIKDNVFFGLHKDLGGIIFDKIYQEGIDKNNEVRLYILDENRMGVFTHFVKSQITKPSQNDINFYQNKIDLLLNAKNKMRKTHCYNCKININSISFSLCKKCKWIKCSCKACGCEYNQNYDLGPNDN